MQLKQIYLKNSLKVGAVKEKTFSVNDKIVDRIMNGNPVEVYLQDDNNPIKIPQHNIAAKVEKRSDQE